MIYRLVSFAMNIEMATIDSSKRGATVAETEGLTVHANAIRRRMTKDGGRMREASGEIC
jgi:hypothetical protein